MTEEEDKVTDTNHNNTDTVVTREDVYEDVSNSDEVPVENTTQQINDSDKYTKVTFDNSNNIITNQVVNHYTVTDINNAANSNQYTLYINETNKQGYYMDIENKMYSFTFQSNNGNYTVNDIQLANNPSQTVVNSTPEQTNVNTQGISNTGGTPKRKTIKKRSKSKKSESNHLSYSIRKKEKSSKPTRNLYKQNKTN